MNDDKGTKEDFSKYTEVFEAREIRIELLRMMVLGERETMQRNEDSSQGAAFCQRVGKNFRV